MENPVDYTMTIDQQCI